jgi:uncharacterized protein (DUF433 family)
MELKISSNGPVPISIDTDDVARVANTRVTLEQVVDAFREGATPEEIVLRYPVLHLIDVYSVITYYLHHQAEIEKYVEKESTLDEEARKEVEARSDTAVIRARLLARQASAES